MYANQKQSCLCQSFRFVALPLSEFEDDLTHFAYKPYLFNQKRHVLFQPFEKAMVVLALSKDKVFARTNLFLGEDKEHVCSPSRGSFGGVEFSDKMRYDVLGEYLDFLDDVCLQIGAKEIKIKSFPMGFQHHSAVLHTLMLQKGFVVIQTDLNQHLDLIADYALHHSTQRSIEKCIKAGFLFQASPLSNLEKDLTFVYDFVKRARERKGFPISLTFERFLNLFRCFPKEHKVFFVKDRSKIIALTVTISINEAILYNFYPADNPDYLSYSPSTFLYSNLLAFAKTNQYNCLDLGVSTDGGIPNFGLLRFKNNFGSIVSLKHTYLKKI